MFTQRVLCFCLFALLPFGSIAQQYYRWVDADGVSHFSQYPPEEFVEAEAILLPRNAETGPVISENVDRAVVDAPSAPAPVTETYANNAYGKDPQLCAQIRQTLTSMTEYSDVRISDPTTGEETELTDEAKVAELERLDHLRAYYCE